MAAEQMEHAAAPRWPNVNVPPGYRFKPTPRELIQCYLEPWVGTEPGHQSPGEFYGIMAAADVYGDEPGALASRFQHIAHDDGNWYFLSVVRWKDGTGTGNASSSSSSNSKPRMNRTVGGAGAGGRDLGTWHGSGKRIPVRGAGYRQSFEFRPAGGGKATWLMEEFGTVRDDATGHDGVRVLCRLHLRPKAAAVAADGEDERQQQQVEVNDVPAPCNKRQRQLDPVAARQVEHHFDADYWTAAPDGGFSNSYATTAAPAPAHPDVGCSYATTSSQQAAAAAATVTERQQQQQQQVEVNDALAPCNKRQRQRAPVEHHFDADYWTAAAPNVGFAAPAPPDVGCSYAPVTEPTAEALATWQHQPMMEQAGDGGYQYHCAGGVYVSADGEAQPLEVGTADVEFTAQDLKMEDSDFVFTVDHLLQLDDVWNMDNAFSFVQPMSDGVQKNNDPKPIDDGVQKNNDLKPIDDGVQKNNDPKPMSDGVQKNNDPEPIV